MIENYILYKGAWIFSGEAHMEEKLKSSEVKSLLKRGGIMVRNTYNFDCSKETSFWWIIKDSFGGRSELGKKTNKYIEKALAKFDIRIISIQEFRQGGYEVYEAAHRNYKIKSNFSSKEFFYDSLDLDQPNIDIWGAIDLETGKLAAYSIVKCNEDTVEYNVSKGDPSYFAKFYPMYGLYYKRNEYYLGEKKYKYAVSSARSLTEHSNIQNFLIEKFKFRKAYCRLDVHYAWWLKLVVKSIYPFRKYIKNRKIQAVLFMEDMSKGRV
jgi:hypothetical protein